MDARALADIMYEKARKIKGAMDQMMGQLDQKRRAQARAVEDVEYALAELEVQGRRPDSWERFYLAHAVTLLGCGEYQGASRHVDWAMTPVAKRSPQHRRSSKPFYDRLGINTLRREFEEARAQPLREAPDLSYRPTFQAQPEI